MSWVGRGSQGVTGWSEESHQARADSDLVCVLSLWPLGKSQNSLRPAAAHLVFADPPDSLKRHWSLGWGPVSSTESSPKLPRLHWLRTVRCCLMHSLPGALGGAGLRAVSLPPAVGGLSGPGFLVDAGWSERISSDQCSSELVLGAGLDTGKMVPACRLHQRGARRRVSGGRPSSPH